jgi:hypothetical protein
MEQENEEMIMLRPHYNSRLDEISLQEQAAATPAIVRRICIGVQGPTHRMRAQCRAVALLDRHPQRRQDGGKGDDTLAFHAYARNLTHTRTPL